MKTNKIIFLVLLMISSMLSANEPLIQKKKVPLDIALPLLHTIDEYAISIGNGPTQMYAFIDPVCPMSRDFVEMVMENKKMQKLYTYHFFFYELERFHTKALIAKIYSSKDIIFQMNKIMIQKQKTEGLKVIPKEIQDEMNSISKVAQELDIYKRPYLFVIKPNQGGN